MRKRNSDPLFASESTIEKRDRKTTLENDFPGGATMDVECNYKTGNGQSGEDEEMINVVDVSDSEDRMDSTDVPQAASTSFPNFILNAPETPADTESSTLASSLPAAHASAVSLPLDLSKKKRRLTASTSLTEDSDQKDEEIDNCDSDQRQRKGIAGFSGTRGGSFGAGTSSSSSTIKWRRQPLECETPSRGHSPSVVIGGAADGTAALQAQPQSLLNRNAAEAWHMQQTQTRPSVIRSAEFTFDPPESTDVDEHFRKSLIGGGQATTEADAKVDDHFARALGDVWWALKNRMHLTPRGEDNVVQRSSPSPASPQSSLAPFCATVPNSNWVSSSAFSSTAPVASGDGPTKANAPAAFPCSTPLKKRILSKAAVEEAARRLELSNAAIQMADNNETGQDNYSDHINNNADNGSNSDEDSRKSLSAPNTPPPTPL